MFVPLSLLAPLLVTNLFKDLAWPVRSTRGGGCVHAGKFPPMGKGIFINLIFYYFYFISLSLFMETRILQVFMFTLSSQGRWRSSLLGLGS